MKSMFPLFLNDNNSNFGLLLSPTIFVIVTILCIHFSISYMILEGESHYVSHLLEFEVYSLASLVFFFLGGFEQAL